MIRFADMAASATPGALDSATYSVVREFAARCYRDSGAVQFGISEDGLAEILAGVASHGEPGSAQGFLASLRLEELVLARACAAGNERAWETFLTRYRVTLYGAAYKIARQESAARELADSLYAELYGVSDRRQERSSKLLYYQGRGSLHGWLRTVVAQEYINRYRSTRREISLDAALEDGQQFQAVEADPVVAADPRAESAAAAELASLGPEERFLLAAYYLDRKTLAEIAKLLRVHESTISRKLERITSGLRKHIRKRMIQSGMSPRQADEAMQDVDVRDLRVNVSETLRQGAGPGPFYKQKSENQG